MITRLLHFPYYTPDVHLHLKMTNYTSLSRMLPEGQSLYMQPLHNYSAIVTGYKNMLKNTLLMLA